MRIVSLEYHDIVASSQWDESGFSGPEAATYKIEQPIFESHLKAFADRGLPHRRTVRDLLAEPFSSGVILTFDDGGVSAATCIADLLDDAGWIGHFFVSTNMIGKQGFLSADQIRRLRNRGHVVGSHSASHPLRMAALRVEEIRSEWETSTRALADILSEPVRVASVPGGHFSRRVAESAAAAGIRVLFTSEPTVRRGLIEGCVVLGRYTLRQASGPAYAAALAAGAIGPRLGQSMLWSAKKIAKAIAGDHYLRLRGLLLQRAARREGAQ